MKKNKLLALLLIAVLVVGVALFAACNKDGESKKPGEGVKIVYLGDSIAEALLGPSPVSERDNYGYPNVLAKINGFETYNRSVSGHRTGDLLELLGNPYSDENPDGNDAKMTVAHVKTADIIHISILGNDLLQEDLDTIILEAFSTSLDEQNRKLDLEELEYNDTQLWNILYGSGNGTYEASVNNVKSIVQTLKIYNPDAKIFFQAVYNPFHDDSTLLLEESKTALKEYAQEGEEIRDLARMMLDVLNGVLDAVLTDNEIVTKYGENAFYVLDGAAAFDKVWNKDAEKGKELIYNDFIHPSNHGHAVLCDLTQEKFIELGITDNSTLAYYKQLRISMMERMFAESITDMGAAKSAINDADSFSEVTESYFDAIRGLAPKYF